MNLTPCWLLLGGSAFALVFVNLIRAAVKKHRGWRALLLASLSCGALAILCAFRMIYVWARTENISSLLDVVPAMSLFSAWALCLGAGLNLLALWLHLRVEKSKEGTHGNS